MSLEKAFEGCKTIRGYLDYIEVFGPGDTQKKGWEEKTEVDWKLHLSGKRVQGASPIDVERKKCKWICVDIDNYLVADLPGKIFELVGIQYFCFKTMSGQWRVVEFFDNWIDVDEASERAKELEKKIENLLFIRCDTTHTLPKPFKNKPGGWIFLPYHPTAPTKDNGSIEVNTKAYSPGGRPLSKTQCDFRIKHREHPIVVASVGITGGGEEGSRNKTIFACKLYEKHFDYKLDYEELNRNFGEPLSEAKLREYIRTTEKSIEAHTEYDKKYLLNGMPTWIKEICGFSPMIDDKGLSVLNEELTEQYVYVRSIKEFFEYKTHMFVDKEGLNDSWLHYTKKQDKISTQLLKSASLPKTTDYICHPKLKPGVVDISPRELPGVTPGKYLNTYKPIDIEIKNIDQGKVKRVMKYYKDAIGEEAFDVLIQYIVFILKCLGEKARWSIIWWSEREGVGKNLWALMIEAMLGERNVETNASFERLTNNYSTLIQGKQFIVLNEVVTTAKRSEAKELATLLKPYITDDVVILNPKFQSERRVPNFCNFFIYSNSKKCISINEQDRRYYIINADVMLGLEEQKQRVKEVKDDILYLIKNPSGLLWWFTQVELKNKKMFFEDAPMSSAKAEMIKDNKDDFTRLLDSAKEDETFPFENYEWLDESTWTYKGLMGRDDLYEILGKHPKFRGVYKDLSMVETWLSNNCTPFPNGEKTKQIEKHEGLTVIPGKKKRVYCIHNYEEPKYSGKFLIELSYKKLGQIYNRPYQPPKKAVQEHERKTKEFYENQKKATEQYSTFCWNCGEAIELTEATKCPECDFAVKCPQCGKCACDKPGSKIKKK